MIAKLLNFKVFTLLTVLMVLVSLFYWFQFRPGQIRSECSRNAVEDAIKFKNKKSPLLRPGDTFSTKTYENYYKLCLRDKGLK